MNITKDKIDIRAKLRELLNLDRARQAFKSLGVSVGKQTDQSHALQVTGGAAADTLVLQQLEQTIPGDAQDLFVYDTSLDSDGGAWRRRVSHTSWYNETLNTDTRGSRREFPAVAVIVTEQKRVTIYDADDAQLSMWMVFDGGGRADMIYGLADSPTWTQVCMLNGKFCWTGNHSGQNGLIVIDFIKDDGWLINDATVGPYKYNGNISQRNDALNIHVDQTFYGVIVNRVCHDVDMTVEPGAPIDHDTGLPVPTIAVATAGGVSLLQNDGSPQWGGVVNATWEARRVMFDSDHNLWASANSGYGAGLQLMSQWPYSAGVKEIGGFHQLGYPTIHMSDDDPLSYDYGAQNLNWPYVLGSTSREIAHSKDHMYLKSDFGLSVIHDNTDDRNKSLAARITDSYNTGWTTSNTKLVALCDTTPGRIGTDETNLVLNGNFSTNYDSWVASGSTTLSVDNNRLVVRSTTNEGIADQEVTLHAGVVYEVSGYGGFDASTAAFSTGIYIISPDNTSSVIMTTTRTGDGAKTGVIRYTPTTTGTHKIRLQSNVSSGDGYASTFDNISIKPMGNFVINGTFDGGTAGWSLYTGAGSITRSTERFPNGGIKIVVGSGSLAPVAIQTITGLQVGKRYMVSADVFVPSTNNCDYATISVDNSAPGLAGSMQTWSMTTSIDDTHNISFVFEATDTNATLFLSVLQPEVQWGAAGDEAHFDNISIREEEADRSAYRFGTQVIGQLDKTPVAPGAELVAYSGFSANDYLVQPYNSDLDFGTGDFCVMGWFKQSPTTDFHTYFDRGGAISVYIDASTSKMNFRVDDGTNHINCLPTTAGDDDVWTFFVGVKSGTTVHNYINGKLEAIGSNPSLGSLGGEFDSHFGVSHDGLRYADKMALWRISATAPTTEQIAKIYRDEKALFQNNAGATLTGSDTYGYAMDHDDGTGLLHVGTTDSHDVFSGLARVDQHVVSRVESNNLHRVRSQNNLTIQQ